MAAGQRVDVAGIAAADDAGDGDAGVAAGPDHRAVALGQAGIAQRQTAEPVVFMRVDPGIVEDDVGQRPAEPLRQRRQEGLEIVGVAGAVGQRHVEIGLRLAHRIVPGAMQRQGEHPPLVLEDAGRAVTLVDVAVDDQDAAGIAVGQKQRRRHRHVVEHREAGAAVPRRMMAAAGRVAGEPLDERQMGGQHRAAGRTARAQRHLLVHPEADRLLHLRRHGRKQHLVDIERVVRQAQPVLRRRRRFVVAAGRDEPVLDEDFGEPREFRHRKPVRGVEIRVEGGMVDDRKRHSATS